MTQPLRPLQGPYQFTLRRFLLAVALLSAFMALAIDTWRRFKRFEILIHFNWIGDYSDAQLQGAVEEGPWLLAELAVLSGATIALAIWARGKLAGVVAAPTNIE